MEQEFWQGLWENNEIGFNQAQPNDFLKKYFNLLHLKRGDKIFVPLCGKSIDMIWLMEEGYKVVGIELSSIACEAFFDENHLSFTIAEEDGFIIFRSQHITLLAGDFFQLSHEILGKIDAVYDRAALIALPQDLRQLYAEHLIQLLQLSTPIFLITMLYNQNEMNGPPFSVEQDEINLLYENFNIRQLASVEVNSTPTHLKARGLTNVMEQVYCLKKSGIM